jgi:hypothetical protein
MVSESGITEATARWPFAVLGDGGLGCSIFGLDGDPLTPERQHALDAHADNDHLLAPIDPILARAAADGRIHAFLQTQSGLSPHAGIGGWTVTVSFGARWGDPAPTAMPTNGGIGRVLVVQLDPTHWLVAGMAARVDIASKRQDQGAHEVLSVEEGRQEPDGWRTTRLLNGDETDSGLNLDPHGQLLRVTLTAQ